MKNHTIRNRLCMGAGIVIILYMGLIWFLVSAAFIPSFMQKLTIFEKISEKCYGEQVQSDDIKKHIENGANEYKAWRSQVKMVPMTETTDDGYKLIATLFPGREDSHVWVLILHGYTGWKETMYGYAYFYSKKGFHVIVPDLRAQGESQGDYIGMGWTDHYDCMKYIDTILEKDREAQIILQGQSMGAATALLMSGEEDIPDNVKFIVSECSYTDAYSMFGQKAGEWFHLPAFPFVDSMRLMLLARGGYDLKKADPLKAVRKSRIPTLFIHGDQDKMIDVSHSKVLYQEASCPKDLVIIEGAGHAQCQAKAPATFNNAINNYIHTYLD